MPEPFSIVYGGRFSGLNVQQPEIFLDPSESPHTVNFWFRNNELRSSPPFVQIFPGPDGSNPILGQMSFSDARNTTHTCCWTTKGLWQLQPYNSNPGVNPWEFVGGPQINQTVVSARAFANVLYYTNGGVGLYSWDGIANAPVLASGLTDASFGGTGSSIGGVYLYEINNQICLLNVTLYNKALVGSTPAGSQTQFPQRIWYSANGVPNQFDPTVNTSAGFVDFLDVPDIITGVIALGEVAYIFRSNGITEQTITGNGLAPFYFDPLWASERGIGSVYPFAIAQYGSVGFFISTEDIYTVSINSFQAIGTKQDGTGGVRDAIMTDLANAVETPVASVIPSYSEPFVYLTYRISIPMKSLTRSYFYSLQDKNWGVEETPPGLQITARPTTCWI